MSSDTQRVCAVPGCGQPLSNPTHDFCYQHWKTGRGGSGDRAGLTQSRASAPAKDDDDGSALSSTKLGRHFEISARRMNLVLAELGWIEKYTKGWTPTDRGTQLGATVREVRQTGIPYVVWPERITQNRILLAAIREQAGEAGQPLPEGLNNDHSASSSTDGFRDRFPARFRATDGHMVRSRAEMLIDNWLYMQGIVHAFERKLPIEEEVYCDFYLPGGKVYIEYWGLEGDTRYAERMKAKKTIYERYQLNLVELSDNDIMNLDDVLPRLLLKFSIDCT